MTIEFARFVFEIFNLVVISYFVTLNGFYLLTSLFAFRALRKYTERLRSIEIQELLESAGAPPVTLIAPAFNEEASIVEAVHAFLALQYPEYEILVVNDGSTDETLRRLIDAFDLEPAARTPTASIPTALVRTIYASRRYPNLHVIEKENSGKADALNVGVNFCRTPLFCALDADTLIERDALLRIVRPFLEERRTIAAGGTIRIANGCSMRGGIVTQVRLPRSWLARFQVVEYFRAFLAGRVGWDAFDTTLVISGAFGIFSRRAVEEVGGYASKFTSGETVGEDMELVVRMHRWFRRSKRDYRIAFIPDPVAWTECPESFAGISRQRNRWQRGLIESLARHRTMLFSARYGRTGMIAFPYFYFLEMLGPVIEVCGYVSFAVSILLGWASPAYVAAFMFVAFGLGIALSAAAVALEELTFRRYIRVADFAALIGLAILENFGFRQLSTLWRFQGVMAALRGHRGWGKMERKGFPSRD